MNQSNAPVAVAAAVRQGTTKTNPGLEGSAGEPTKPSSGSNQLNKELTKLQASLEATMNEKLQAFCHRLEGFVREELVKQSCQLQGQSYRRPSLGGDSSAGLPNGKRSGTKALTEANLSTSNGKRTLIRRSGSGLSDGTVDPVAVLKEARDELSITKRRASFRVATGGDKKATLPSVAEKESEEIAAELRPVGTEGTEGADEYTLLLPPPPASGEVKVNPFGGQPRRRYIGPDMIQNASVKELMLVEQVEEGNGEDLLKIEEPDDSRSWWDMLSVFVQSDTFDLSVGLIIILNAACTGMQINYQAKEWTTFEPVAFQIANYCFSIAFMIELCLRAVVYRKTFLMYVSRNMIDTVIILLQFSLEVHVLGSRLLGDAWHRTPHWLGVIRIVRLLRLVRVIKNSNMLQLLGELHMMVASIVDSVRSCFWSLVLMLSFMYTFSIYITMLVTQHKLSRKEEGKDAEEGPNEELLYFFGSLDSTMLSLFQASMDGMHWHELMDPLLRECGPWHAFLIIAYMTFTLLVLMNIVTSVFVTSAMKHAEDDKKQVLMVQMQAFFRECDDDGSGSISWDEFQNHLQHPQLQNFLREIDLHPDHARALFRLLDTSGTGDVGIDELVGGCLRLHGPATSIDLSTLTRETERSWEVWSEHASFVTKALNSIMQHVGCSEEDLIVAPEVGPPKLLLDCED
eukprot:TRINITY_DN22441_c0_g2_i1.p1 TRINITY_DN22441_c0_g2~~TRINITY_DN22441_c0_g2_i1.p1  ORF type:complete len:685 (+),score=170.59 TRINITY_DN22441_c0_g2_i1:89-2143(+)